MSATPNYPPVDDPDPMSERERVELWRENELIRAGFPERFARDIARSDADLHRAVELLTAGCSIHTALEILL